MAFFEAGRLFRKQGGDGQSRVEHRAESFTTEMMIVKIVIAIVKRSNHPPTMYPFSHIQDEILSLRGNILETQYVETYWIGSMISDVRGNGVEGMMAVTLQLGMASSPSYRLSWCVLSGPCFLFDH